MITSLHIAHKANLIALMAYIQHVIHIREYYGHGHRPQAQHGVLARACRDAYVEQREGGGGAFPTRPQLRACMGGARKILHPA